MDQAHTAAPQGAAFRFLQQLGDGPTGEAWLVEQAGTASPPRRALKLRGGADPERQRAESARLAHLDHPGIAKVERVVTLTDGTVALIGEHVPGADLAAVQATLRDLGVPLSPRAAGEITALVAEALDFAWNHSPDGHPFQVAHLDLKPTNVRLTPDGEVKVVDFGVAALTAPETEGMLRYHAPERLLGVYEGPESDVYALGKVILELLLGGTLPTPPLARDEHVDWVEESLSRLPPAVSPLADLLRGMLAFEAFARPPAAEVHDLASRIAGRLPGASLARLARRLATAGQQTAPGATRRLEVTVPIRRPRSLGWTVAFVALVSVAIASLAVGLLFGVEPLLARASVIAPS